MSFARRPSAALEPVLAVGVCWLALLAAPAPAPAAPPANDARATAEPLTASLTGRTLAEATTEAGEALACGSTTYDSTVWFRFTAPGRGSVTFRVRTAHRVLSVYRASGTRERCGPHTLQSLEVAPGEELLVQIGRTPAASGFTFDLGVAFTPAPANDLVAGAEPLGALTEVREFTLFGAGLQARERRACEGRRVDHVVWFLYTAPARGLLTATLGTTNRAIGLQAVGGPRRYRCDLRGIRVGGVEAGQQFLIAVGRQSAATGYTTKLTVMLQPAPANDLRAAAQPLEGASGSVSGSLLAAGRESGEDGVCPRRGPDLSFGESVWFRFVAPARGDAEFSVPTGSRALVVYRGTSTGGSCDDHEVRVRGLRAQEELLILVGRSPTASAYDFTLEYRFAPDPDQDRDGFDASGGDCDDSRRDVNPDAIDRPRDGLDQNCDGADTTTARVTEIELRATVVKVRRGKRLPASKQPIVGVRYVRAAHVRAGATVELRCTGRGCRRSIRRERVRRSGAVRFDRPLRHGSTLRDSFGRVEIEVLIEYPDAVGQYSRWIVKKDRFEAVRKNRCTYPGGHVAACGP